jgi:uncharacterized protein
VKRLRISDGLALPAHEAQTQTFVVYGGKGMGKTNFGAVFAEELHANDLRFSWFDPVGVAWGLKHSADGRGEGVEVLILGGAHGDIPIHPQAGSIVADLVVDEAVSVIVDVSRHVTGKLWTGGEKTRFAIDYFTRLYQRQGERRRPLMQIVDEAGRFVPQDIPARALDIMECVGAIEQLVELGRNVGVGVCLITQRSARMRKSVSELAECMLAFRTVGPRSLKAIEDWFEEYIERKHALELRNRIRELPRGTAMVVSPGWLQVEGEYAIRARETFDSSATPVAGKERRPSGKGARVDLALYEARMAETIEQANANDPTELRRQLREEQKRAHDLGNQVMALRAEQAAAAETVVETIVERVEVPVFTDDDRQLLERAHTAFDEATQAAGFAKNAMERVEWKIAGPEAERVAPRPIDPLRPRAEQAERTERADRTPQPETVAAPARPPAPPAAELDGVSLKPGARRMLDVLAGCRGGFITKAQLATLANIKPTGGTFSSYLSNLRVNGLVRENGNTVAVSDLGAALYDKPPALPPSSELYSVYRRKLKPGAQRMLDVLWEGRHGSGVPRDELAELADVSSAGGTFSSYLSNIRVTGLLDETGGRIALNDVMFWGDR